MKNKKERNLHINIELRENTKLDWDPDTKTMRILGEDGNLSGKNLISIGQGYFREGKLPKTIRQVSNPSGALISLGAVTPKVDFDKYIAIDTSYKEMYGKYVCASGAIALEDPEKKVNWVKGDKVCFRNFQSIFFLGNVGTKPERFSWMKYLDGLEKSEEYKKGNRYCVIVDSDLNELEKINNKDIPIYENYYLPENVTLAYASADSGKEHMYNVMIGVADKLAKKSLDIMMEQYTISEFESLPTDFFILELASIPVNSD